MKLKVKYNAPVVLTFALVCGLTLLVNFLTQGARNRLLFIVRRGSFADPLTWLRLFTHVLGHASWEHYAGNMMLFLLIGPMLEEKYGSRDLLLVIAVTALVTGAVQQFVRQGKRVAAICAAPSVLGALGLLRGKKATCYPGFEQALEGAEATGAEAVTDGLITTGQGLGAAIPFALELAALLEGPQMAQKVRQAIVYKH